VWSDPEISREFVARIGERLSARLTLYDTAGTLLASTDPAAQKLLGQRFDVPGLAQVLLSRTALRVEYGSARGTGAAEVLVPVWIGRSIVGVILLADPLSSVYERFARTRTLILIVLVGGLVAGSGVGWLLALDLERPLWRAARAIAGMATGQPLGTLPEQGPEEVRLLVRAFNTLAARLQDLERTRQRLLANLVHELGRPLGALLSAVQALSRGAGEDPAMRRELLAGMEGEIQQTERLLADLTHLYDQSLGPLELDLRPTSLGPWLLAALSPWRVAAEQKSLHWQVTLADGLPTLPLDPDRMAQALGNILSNAIKYTAEGGAVTVASGTTAQEAWIAVRDSGPGIAAEEQERVFAPLYRAPARRRFPQGMGLGLSIARDLVAAHGGRLTLESTPGVGSAFTIWLPLPAAPPGAPSSVTTLATSSTPTDDTP
jgi:signal transduction histidine kinase